ncbi:maltase 2-like [Paramacrobiotus metropolitanus]|uniref:maltase 2-like n=1 Tax=Paramacrobiotus metropolitanus TaxID=2943436 RepID=UPI0024460511|nr:maltase 2-like [Paramacrobiotus metropolitanus]XP_055327922.1 maltase 2-like [Paramacrobiotus metropolitanus]XP_055327923.1 maltase 2-like [Paramacrobiotus metropolitanus]
MDLSAADQTDKSRRRQHKKFCFDLYPLGKNLSAASDEQRTFDREWWHNTIVYQIYPRSFQDASGDGIGDLAGITSRLPYLKELGIESIWISPFYESPMEDFGYDISDFCQVDPIFGKLADFDQLISAAHSLGIYVIVDFVPNHTSDKHPWFEASRDNRINPYADYYVWHSGDTSRSVNRRGISIPAPPTLWNSVFGGSAWEWCDRRSQYYLHQFLPSQPDLNFRCPAVVQAMDDVLLFWLKRGVDGFRMDAVKHLYEVPVPEHPRSRNFDKESQMHNQPETLEMVSHWRSLLDEYAASTCTCHKLLNTEVTGKIEECIPYYRCGADYSFNFGLLSLDREVTGFDMEFYVCGFLKLCGQGVWPNWVVGNHDIHRVADRFGSDKIVDGMNMLNLLLPGTANVYYGEELGMHGARIEFFGDVKDTFAKRDSIFWKLKNRDPARSPMQWTDESTGGFSKMSPWLPLADNYRVCNVEIQETELHSHLNTFKQLVALRKHTAFAMGRFETAVASSSLFSFYRQCGADIFIVIIDVRLSVAKQEECYDFSSDKKGSMGEVVVCSGSCAYEIGDRIALDTICLNPCDALVVKILAVD